VGWFASWLTAAQYPYTLTQILKSSPAQAFDIVLQNLSQNLTQFDDGRAPEIAMRWQIVGMIVGLGAVALVYRLPRIRSFSAGFSRAETWLHLYNLGSIMLVMLLLYSVYDWRDYRVIAPHLLFTLLLFVAFRRRVWLIALIAVGLFTLPQAWPVYESGVRDHLRAQQTDYDVWRVRLADVIRYQPDVPNAWCNTILHSPAYFEPDRSIILLAMDGGFGLSWTADINPSNAPLKSRYLLLDDAFYERNAAYLHVEKLLDVTDGSLYLNLDSAC
jgi:hypothetical protein